MKTLSWCRWFIIINPHIKYTNAGFFYVVLITTDLRGWQSVDVRLACRCPLCIISVQTTSTVNISQRNAFTHVHRCCSRTDCLRLDKWQSWSTDHTYSPAPLLFSRQGSVFHCPLNLSSLSYFSPTFLLIFEKNVNAMMLLFATLLSLQCDSFHTIPKNTMLCSIHCTLCTSFV